MTTTAGETPSKHIQNDAGSIADGVELRHVYFESLAGRAFGHDRPGDINIQVNANATLNDNRLRFKLDFTCTLQAAAQSDQQADDSKLASIDLVLICEFDARDETLFLDEQTLDSFAEQVALGVAFPYVREAVSSMLVRLGFPSVTLGLVTPGAPGPKTASARP